MTDSPVVKLGANVDTITMLMPDFPFSYDRWIRHRAGLGRVPDNVFGTPVAVVGGGISGLVAAYELMRLGLRPVVYEPEGLGGRMRSVRFPEAPDFVADLGAMRFPLSSRTLFHYIDMLGLSTSPFPNPLAPSAPTTVIDIDGVTRWAGTADDLPEVFQQVADAWEKALNDGAELSAMKDAIRRRDVSTIKRIWNRLVTRLDDQSFYGFLASSPAFASFRHREIFGQVGFGAGGWDTDFPNSILEILRVIYTHAEQDHVRIDEGAQRLPELLWAHRPAQCAYWPSGTSLADLHDGQALPGVTALRPRDGGIEVVDADGDARVFPAVVYTPHVWTMLTRVDCAEQLLTPAEWTAVERTHYMASSKLFVLVDRPFWKDVNPATGNRTMGMTLTDRFPRGVYLLEKDPDGPAVMCLSYTWNDDSAKLLTFSDEERLAVLLRRLSAIYPGVDIESHIISKPIVITWESEPNFMGAFRANLPGQYRYQRRLYTQFMHRDAGAEQRGFYLCGDDVGWTGGFAEGAVTTALNAVWGVLTQLGGRTDPANPGPGDQFDELAPVELPM